jgi:hypothetical protein
MVFADILAVIIGGLLALLGLLVLFSDRVAEKVSGKSGLVRLAMGLLIAVTGLVSIVYFGTHLANRHALLDTFSQIKIADVKKISFNLVGSINGQPAKYIDKRPIGVFLSALERTKAESETVEFDCSQTLQTYIFVHQQEDPLKLNLCLDLKKANLFFWKIEDEALSKRRDIYSCKPLFAQARSVAVVLSQPAYSSSFGGLSYEKKRVFRTHSADLPPRNNLH